MTTSSLTKEQILHDMESVFQKAFADGKWQIALRAKELQSKILGFFEKIKEAVVSRAKNSPSPLPDLSHLPRQQRRYQMRELARDAARKERQHLFREKKTDKASG